MPTLVRGVNPIWSEFDLTGHIFDDTYWLFTLNNTVPYNPIPIKKDMDGNVTWSDPIQFLANGTLPENMFWDPGVVYRLEFRKGNTQQDALIYLIENYVPSGGSVTPTSSGNDTTNQITNPQFSVVSFGQTGVTSTAAVIPVAPGWDVVTTGSGSVTVTQLPIAGVSVAETNPPFALRIASTGFDRVGIRQTFAQNGALWAGEAVAVSITAEMHAGTPVQISSFLTYNTQIPIQIVSIFTTPTLTSAFAEYTGATPIPPSTNISLPDTASTSLTFDWPGLSNTVDVTSIQIVGQDANANVQVAYQQETIERQIDQTFHVYANSLIMQPKDSVLTGWNMGQNPWQSWGIVQTSVPVNQYTADQTVVIQQPYVSIAQGLNLSVGQDTPQNNFAFNVRPVNSANQFALIQYIDPKIIGPYWQRTLSALVRLKLTSVNSTSLNVKMKLICRTTLPDTVGQNEPIAAWTYAGEPIFSAAWIVIPPITPTNDPTYTLTNATSYREIAFDGFTLPTATTATMTLGVVFYTLNNMSTVGTPDKLSILDISLVPNDFAIESNVLTFDETLRRCQYYYETTYQRYVKPGTFPATEGSAIFYQPQSTIPAAFQLNYLTQKRFAASIDIYSPTTGAANSINSYAAVGAGAQQLAVLLGGPWAQSATLAGTTSTVYVPTSAINVNSLANATYSYLNMHWVANSRMGI